MTPSSPIPEEGLVLAFDKPADWTSFDVVRKVRRLSGVKKVGHAGTLDPFATGILLICLGRATKRSDELMALPKAYIADIALGAETDTMDRTGTATLEKPVPPFDTAAVEAACARFTGEIEQEIPAFSAAKVNGQRSYRLARAGKPVPQRFKTVAVYEIEVLEVAPERLRIRVACGRGTFIRTLARDIARALGTAGHVAELVRTRVGDYALESALSVAEYESQQTGTDVSQ